MGKFIDLKGCKFGRLTVDSISHSKKINNTYYKYWVCKCDCGNTVVVEGNNLRRGRTTSCGCLRNENLAREARKNIKHNLSKSRIWGIYSKMKARCCNCNNPDYERYGGRGITICNEWLNDFKSFVKWAMDNGYNDSLSIDRVDNNGNYEPSNCRWVDAKTQSRNRSSNIKVVWEGNSITLIELSGKVNIPYPTLRHRFNKGDRGEYLVRPLDDTKRTTAKLSDEQVLEIRDKFSNGTPAYILDKEYNVSRQTIFNVAYRKTYKNVK